MPQTVDQQRKRWTDRARHPLCGADLGTLTKMLVRSGGLPIREWPGMGLIFGAALGRAPFTLAELAVAGHRLGAAPPMKAPVFIVGHWRSGTTHLYNLMSLDDEYGFVPPLAAGMPWDMLVLVRMLRPLLEKALPSHRFIDGIPVTPSSPQEDEVPLASMGPVSFFHGIYFPKRYKRWINEGLFLDGLSPQEIEAWERRFSYFLGKLALTQENRTLLIKNPVYTARIPQLRKLYPDAKFIHIHRDPRDVFLSMRNFYDKLFREFALQDHGHVDVDELILDIYMRMMTRFETDAPDVPASHLVEIAYQDLVDAPVSTLETIYRRLGLPGFDAAKPAFESYLEKVALYRNNVYARDTALIARAEEVLAPAIRRYGTRGGQR